MKHSNILLLVFGWSVALTWPALAEAPQNWSNSRVVIWEGSKGDGGYWDTTSIPLNADGKFDPNGQYKPLPPDREAARQRMIARGVLEQYVEFLSPLYLPHTLGLFASDCNGKRWDSPHYDPYLHAINMCYSYILASEREADWFVEYQKKRELPTPVSRDQYLAGLFTAVLLHETGHALFDQLNIPIFGREEDAADEIAAFIALQFDKRTARTVIKGFAYTWTLQRNPPLAAPNTQDPKYPTDPEQQCALDPICAYSDEHGTASQRMYNTLCIAFGGDPSDFQELVDSGWLPKERASHCADEYNQIAFAFQKTIYPFINVDQMKKVQARKWFMPQEEDLTPH